MHGIINTSATHFMHLIVHIVENKDDFVNNKLTSLLNKKRKFSLYNFKTGLVIKEIKETRMQHP